MSISQKLLWIAIPIVGAIFFFTGHPRSAPPSTTPLPVLSIHEAPPALQQPVSPASATAPAEGNGNVLSADNVAAEVASRQAACEAALKDGVPLVRRRASVAEWKAFASARGLFLYAAEMDETTDTYVVQLTTADLPPELSNNGTLVINPGDGVEVGVLRFIAAKSGKVMIGYKPYMKRGMRFMPAD